MSKEEYLPDQLTDRENVKFTNEGYEKLSLNRKVKVNNKIVGYLSNSMENDTNSGLQAYTITSSSPSVAHSQPDKVKEVTIIYRGSTSPAGINSIASAIDFFNDWFKNDLPAAEQVSPLAGGIIGGVEGALSSGPAGIGVGAVNGIRKSEDKSPKVVPPQFTASSKYLKKMMKRYPNAKFNIYGHSLGSMNAQYAAADNDHPNRINKVIAYEGPNIHKILNSKQRKTAKGLKDRVFNYVDSKDLVPLGYSTGAAAVGWVIHVFSKKSKKCLGDQHMWGGYQFTASGEVKVEFDDASVKGEVKVRMHDLMNQYRSMSQTGGGLSSGERIYLDAAQATVFAGLIETTAETGITPIKQDIRKGVTGLQDNQEDVKRLSRQLGSHLTEGEISGALAEVGATQYRLVTVPQAKLDHLKTQANQIESDYKRIAKQVKSGVEQLKDSDRQVAGYFSHE
ncbi:alpha/beta fold hydrolase [Lacticaseibacillus styriensis]|uniref:Alpha/beta fold hydrolase n=1 Tax=Lacticaseibacillus styriensis TaxID=3068306 RepID=A0ABY9L8S8_9LACO|nr:alpha/beta fold hydrolase [Lacticaseibacillus sp. NCIMB 15473]WLV80153.1 alpha/beta fold hydrolase [Lacticaseibacillus sp. NCIMB 15473]